MSLRRTLAAAAAATIIAPPAARAYPIDCAILLCLAGGWPQAAECVAAKAEVIRRITPWPIEPPLQLWRCPIGATLPTLESPAAKIFRVAGGAARNADFRDPIFDFLHALRVYHIRFRESWFERDTYCDVRDDTRVGLYDETGAFHWRRLNATTLPAWAPRPNECAAQRSRTVRAVAIGWQAYDGTRGHEIIHY